MKYISCEGNVSYRLLLVGCDVRVIVMDVRSHHGRRTSVFVLWYRTKLLQLCLTENLDFLFLQFLLSLQGQTILTAHI